MFKLTKYLIENGADVDIRDDQERTPLHFAVVANRISVIQLLIKSGNIFKLLGALSILWPRNEPELKVKPIKQCMILLW